MSKSTGTKMVRISDYVTPVDAAEIIGCTDGRVYQLLRKRPKVFKDVLPVGKNRVMLSRREVEEIAKNPAKTGRPRKSLAS